MEQIRSIPRPLVRTNQWSIVISAVITFAIGQAWFLFIPLLSGLLGLLFKFNPIMRLAKLFLRKNVKEYIQEDWEQQQFNQKIAVSCLTVAVLGFMFGIKPVGYIFTGLVAIAAFVAILGFCIGCFLHYQWKLYTFRRENRKTEKSMASD
ncbi:DUF4395 domain-containing protein [Bacillota bacterium Lsc_1132]